MLPVNRWSPFEDIFKIQRDVDRQFTTPFPFQFYTDQDNWRLELPMPGIDPKRVTIDVTGTSIVVRAEQDGGRYDGETPYERTMTVPQFLDLDRITATHRHGMLELTLPLKDSVKPRRIQIANVAEAQMQLTTA